MISLLTSPSFFRRDPWGFARNQSGHGYIVGGLGTLLAQAWLGPWGVPAVLAVYALWEWVQVGRYGGEVWDSIEDMANVAVIAAATVNPETFLWFMAIHALYLGAGFLRRRK